MELQYLSKLKFIVALGSAHLFALLSVIFTIVWFTKYGEGFAWRNNPSKEFSFHPVFMIIGFIYLYTQASLVYRTFPTVAKPKLKLAHLIIQTIAFVLIVIALVAVFDRHNLSHPPMPNMYSLHSWVGMGTVVLFSCQLLFGFVTFFFPGLPQPIRAFYLPIHMYFGSAIFLLAVASSLLGIMRYAGFNKNYTKFSADGIIANCIGLFIILLAASVLYLLNNSEYKRQPQPQDEQHLDKHYQDEQHIIGVNSKT